MLRQFMLILLMLWAGTALAATKQKPAKSKTVKAPALEKLSCRTGPNDEQARLIVHAVKGRVMEFAFYSRLGTRVCSIDARRGDAHTKWDDARHDDGTAASAVKLRAGMALVDYKPGHVVLKFTQVERMPFCGMYGELNGSVELIAKKTECNIDRIFEGSGEKEENAPGE